jgi:hypothetical protein
VVAVSFGGRYNPARFLLSGEGREQRGTSKGGGGVKLKDWREVLTADLPGGAPVTRKTVEMVREHSRRYRGGMRISTGRIWIDADYEKRRAKVLATPLP